MDKKSTTYLRNGNYYIGWYHGGKRYKRKIGPDKKTAELALKDIE
ncbi:hypothetical protein ACFL2Q_18605 [Thermodesulfobacteriota bacterium]